MRKWIVLLLIVCAFAPLLQAADGVDQHLTPDEFRAKQQEFIIKEAELSKEEAAKFFPLYFELQAKKKEINDKTWKSLREGKDDTTTEARYGEIMSGFYDSRLASDQLDKAYFVRFKTILSNKKLYLVQKAELRFNRELLKGMNDRRGDKRRNK